MARFPAPRQPAYLVVLTSCPLSFDLDFPLPARACRAGSLRCPGQGRKAPRSGGKMFPGPEAPWHAVCVWSGAGKDLAIIEAGAPAADTRAGGRPAVVSSAGVLRAAAQGCAASRSQAPACSFRCDPADHPTGASNRTGRSSVKARLTPNQRRRPVENDEYAAFVRRAIRAHARRVAAGDADALADMTGLAMRRSLDGDEDQRRSADDVPVACPIERSTTVLAVTHRPSVSTLTMGFT